MNDVRLSVNTGTLPKYTPPVLNFDDTIKTAILMVHRRDSSDVAVVRISTTTPIDGNEDSVLRMLRRTGKYDTDQIVWLTETQARKIISAQIEEVTL
jgi:hypothetical protein